MTDLRSAAALALIRMQRLLLLLHPAMQDDSEFGRESQLLLEIRRTLLRQ